MTARRLGFLLAFALFATCSKTIPIDTARAAETAKAAQAAEVGDAAHALAIEHDDRVRVVLEHAFVSAPNADDLPAAVERAQGDRANDGVESGRVAASGVDCDATNHEETSAKGAGD